MQVVGGTMVPANGSPLRPIAGGHELFVKFTLQGGGYGTANAPLNNRGQYTNGANPADEAVDLSGADGFTIEYATTGSAYVQLRTGAVPHGGDHFRADMPNTNGELQTLKLKFADFRRPGGNTPPAADVLGDVFSFTFVAGGTTDLTLRQVSIPGFVPPCD
jgi:hypothetical protein